MKKIISGITAKFRIMDNVSKGIFVFLIALAFIASIFAFQFVRNFTSSMTILNLPGAPVFDTSAGEGTPQATPDAIAAQPTMEPWDGVSRVNILIMGLDYRDWESGETPRSDTMIVFTIDPVTRTAGMLSIPRDIWANIPNFGYYKINEAYFLGEAYKLPGGGPSLAVQTVEQFLGIPIHFYAQIDFFAFIRFIDEIDGVLITPDQDVKVEYMGRNWTQQVLKAGVQYALDGELALAYARNRYTQDADFDRAKRQQEVILAIRDRILQYDQLPTLISKAPVLYQELSTGIRTNLNLQQAIQLGTLALQIPAENIKKGVISTDMIIFTRSPDGLDILKPIPDKIRLLRDDMFATGGAAGPIAQPSANSTLVRDEAAKVLVQNGTLTADLGARTSGYLNSQGIVASEGGADSTYGATQIIIYNAKPYTVSYLAGLMNVASTNIWNKFDPNVGFDIAVILGSDWANNNSLP